MSETTQTTPERRKPTTEEVIEEIHKHYLEIRERRQGKSFDEILDMKSDPRNYKKTKKIR
jgi:hypothetical protein